MAFPKLCTNMVGGKQCGGEVDQDLGVCFNCGADYNSAAPVGDQSAVTDTTGTPAASSDGTSLSGNTSRSGSTSRSGNTSRSGSGTRSQTAKSKLGSGRTVAEVLGLSNVRKVRTDGGSSSSSRSRKGIGRGFIMIPDIPPSDARSLIKTKYMDEALKARTCCGTKDRPHEPFVLLNKQPDGSIRQKGVCPKACADGKPCKEKFDFTGPNIPPLPILPETVIAGQYLNLGTIAKGGNGFIYLMLDQDLSGTSIDEDGKEHKHEQFAVVKAQITQTERDKAVSVAEKQMLANLRDPSIVSVFRFTDFLGMPLVITEWIDGKTVDKIWETLGTAMPVAQAMAYVLGMGDSMEVLHGQKIPVLNPDIKPANWMHKGNRLIQIDAGGWLLSTDTQSNVTSTVGYAPREVDDAGRDSDPTVYSDQYSLGRVAFVMAHYKWAPQGTSEWEKKYRWSLPESTELFTKYPSYEAWVRRATAQDRNNRFASVAEMMEQGWGVLREVVAIDAIEAGSPAVKPWQSPNFDNDASAGSQEISIRMLPGLKIDIDDKAKGEIETILKSSVDAKTMLEMFEGVAGNDNYKHSLEAKLRLANHHIDLGNLDKAEEMLVEIAKNDPDDWRISWYYGKLFMAKKDYTSALLHFDTVVGMLPGEPAAKLASGMAAELKGDFAKAINSYDLVTKVEPQYTSAAFGQARCLLKEGNVKGAVEVLCRVPSGSIARVPAMLSAATTQVQPQAGEPAKDQAWIDEMVKGGMSNEDATAAAAAVPPKPGTDELVKAAGFLTLVLEDTYAWHYAAAQFYLKAAEAVEAGNVKDSKTKVLGQYLTSKKLRKAAYVEYMFAAKMAETEQASNELVELGLKVRPKEIWQF